MGASNTSSPDLEAALGIKTVGEEGEKERRVERVEEREGKREEERGGPLSGTGSSSPPLSCGETQAGDQNYKIITQYVRVHAVRETRQGKEQLRLKTAIFSQRKMSCLRWNSNPRHTAHCADDLPTELPRQLSWAGRILKCYTRAQPSLPR